MEKKIKCRVHSVSIEPQFVVTFDDESLFCLPKEVVEKSIESQKLAKEIENQLEEFYDIVELFEQAESILNNPDKHTANQIIVAQDMRQTSLRQAIELGIVSDDSF
jgi:hypothetical protein